jgi:hypothetical protein
MATKLVNMKIDPKEREKKYAESTVAADGPVYPWGLGLTLDDESLDKLGITKLPTVGKSYTLVAKCDVTSVSESESDMGSRRSVSLQITDLALDFSDEKKDAGESLYPAKG